jgi:hypothetical protein
MHCAIRPGHPQTLNGFDLKIVDFTNILLGYHKPFKDLYACGLVATKHLMHVIQHSFYISLAFLKYHYLAWWPLDACWKQLWIFLMTWCILQTQKNNY